MALELPEPAQELSQHRPPGDAIAEVDTEKLHQKHAALDVIPLLSMFRHATYLELIDEQ